MHNPIYEMLPVYFFIFLTIVVFLGITGQFFFDLKEKRRKDFTVPPWKVKTKVEMKKSESVSQKIIVKDFQEIEESIVIKKELIEEDSRK